MVEFDEVESVDAYEAPAHLSRVAASTEVRENEKDPANDR